MRESSRSSSSGGGVLCLFILISALACAIPAAAQRRVDPRHTHERLLCVVPMTGAGTYADPRRPLYAPLPPEPGKAASREGIIAFTYIASDDGRYALVEFVALDRSAFSEILSDTRSDMKVFEKGKAARGEIETEFRKYKSQFNLDRFGVSVP